MVMEVLEAISAGMPSVPRNVHHDLESFLWVTIYAIYKHSIAIDSSNEELKRTSKSFLELRQLKNPYSP
jgi:hypothetical protein